MGNFITLVVIGGLGYLVYDSLSGDTSYLNTRRHNPTKRRRYTRTRRYRRSLS